MTYELLESKDLISWRPIRSWAAGPPTMMSHQLDPTGKSASFYKLREIPSVNELHSAALYEKGLFAWRSISYLPTQLMTGCVEAVVMASILQTGGFSVITQGHLKQSQNGWEFTSSESDALIVETATSKLAFLISEINGDFSQPYPFAFLRVPHTLEFKVKDLSLGTFEFMLSSSMPLEGGGSVATCQGEIKDKEGNSFSLVTTINREQASEVDGGGQTNGQLTSSLNYAIDQTTIAQATGVNFQFNLSSQQSYRSLYYNHYIENSRRSLQIQWSDSEHAFMLKNAHIKTALRDTYVSDLDNYWLAQGQLLLDGNSYAEIGLRKIESQEGNRIELIVVAKEGESVFEVYPMLKGGDF